MVWVYSQSCATPVSNVGAFSSLQEENPPPLAALPHFPFSFPRKPPTYFLSP